MICDGDNCRITLPPTPAYIKANYLNGTGQPYDVFAETVGKLTFVADPTIITKLVDICWRNFRNRPIGDFDYEYWTAALDDKVNSIWYGYKRTISLLLKDTVADIVESSEITAEGVTNSRDALTTNDLTETNNLTENVDSLQTTAGTVGRVESGTETGTSTVETEDNPDSAAGATKYLNGRVVTTPDLAKTGSATDTSDMDVTVDASKVNTGTVKNTGTVAVADDSVIDRDVTITRNNEMESERILRAHDAVMLGVEKFAKELEPMFMNRW
jgi:hypothetical protein